jgi:hypothetical protein
MITYIYNIQGVYMELVIETLSYAHLLVYMQLVIETQTKICFQLSRSLAVTFTGQQRSIDYH